MRALEVPFLAVLAFLPGLVLASLGWFSLRRRVSLVRVSLVTLASGISLLGVAVASMLLTQPRVGNLIGSPLLLAAPAVLFGMGLAGAVRGRDYEGFRLFGFSVVALALVYGLSFYVALLSACSFGDCL